MGFIAGFMAGVAAAAAVAAWYMSRAGSEFRERYHVEQRLGEFGDEMEVRTRDVRAKVGDQVAEVQKTVEAQVAEVQKNMTGGPTVEGALDDVQAAAAEEAAGIAADVEEAAAKAKRAAKSTASDASSDINPQ
jgi:hypothetical protein